MMNNKKYKKEFMEVQMKLGMLKVITQLQAEILEDDIVLEAIKGTKLLSISKDIIPEIEGVNEKLNTNEARGTTFYSSLESKILYNFRKAYRL